MGSRRFELVDGKSSKFWEVEAVGSDLCLRWGRIGTEGQSKTKSFGSAAAATKEADKQVRSKTKKGYAEVTAPSAEEAVEPEVQTSVQAQASSRSLSARGTDGLRRRLVERARRGSTFTSGYALAPWQLVRDGVDLWPDVKKSAAGKIVQFERGLAIRDDGTTRRLLGVIESSEPPAELDDDLAAQLVRLTAWVGFNYVVRREGPSAGMRALVLSAKVCFDMGYAEGRIHSLVAWRWEDTPSRWLEEMLVDAARVADSLEPGEYAEVARWTRERWSAWPITVRAHVTGWLARDASFLSELLATEPVLDSRHAPAIVAVRSADAAMRIAKNAWGGSFDPAGDRVLRLLVTRLGVEAAPVFAALLEGGAGGRYQIANALTHIQSLETAALFVAQLDRRDLSGLAHAYLEGEPELAIEALASTRKQSARRVLRKLVRQHPSLVSRRLLLRLGDKERAVLLETRDVGVPRAPEADEAELPPVLRAPPWRAKAKPSKAVKLTRELAPVELEERVAWREGQRDAWRRAARAAPPTRVGGERVLAKIERAERHWEEHDRASLDLHAMLAAHDDVLAEVLGGIPTELFAWVEADALRTLVARLSEAGIAAYPRLADVNRQIGAAVFAHVCTPRLAPLYARALAGRTQSRSHAQVWMRRFPEAAAVGLLPAAFGLQPDERAWAEAALRYLASQGFSEQVLAAADRHDDEVGEATRELLARDPLFELPKKIPALPPWADVSLLPRPLLRGGAASLTREATEDLLTMLAFTPLDPAYPGVAQVREACDPASLFSFCWALLEEWLEADGSRKGIWAMLSLAHFGGDEAARRLTPKIRKWPGESAHARAVTALDVLEAIGSDVALMHLHGISQKLKYKGLRRKATDKVAQIAEARGLTADELADRLVPELDLDERGTMVLDFGERSFTVGFDASLCPYVLDGSGKRRKSLPRPGAKDGPGAAEAQKQWKALKKDVRAVASHQLARLERLMCLGRRVDRETFQRFFVDHPLLTHLVQRLIWGWFSDGVMKAAFRVDHSRTFADSTDEPVSLPDGAEVGLLHPLHIDTATRERFIASLGDYELIQPFRQLDRPTFEATDEAALRDLLATVSDLQAELGAVRSLETVGWSKGTPQDGGLIHEILKPIPGTGIKVSVGLDPGFAADGYDYGGSDTQTLATPVLCQGASLLNIGPVQLSELVLDLRTIGQR